jgi:hypothetical protein
MKKYPVLLLLLAALLLSGLAFSALAADIGPVAPPFKIYLTVTSTTTMAINRVTYTAKLSPPPDAPKLIDFYMADSNIGFPNKPIASVWTDVYQVATYTFPQAPGIYSAMAVWAPWPVKSNIVTYKVY